MPTLRVGCLLLLEQGLQLMNVLEWLKGWINTTYREFWFCHHGTALNLFADTVGSLSMLPRRKGGVVDPRLKVSWAIFALLRIHPDELTWNIGIRY